MNRIILPKEAFELSQQRSPTPCRRGVLSLADFLQHLFPYVEPGEEIITHGPNTAGFTTRASLAKALSPNSPELDGINECVYGSPVLWQRDRDGYATQATRSWVAWASFPFARLNGASRGLDTLIDTTSVSPVAPNAILEATESVHFFWFLEEPLDLRDPHEIRVLESLNRSLALVQWWWEDFPCRFTTYSDNVPFAQRRIEDTDTPAVLARIYDHTPATPESLREKIRDYCCRIVDAKPHWNRVRELDRMDRERRLKPDLGLSNLVIEEPLLEPEGGPLPNAS